jgi:NAD(P)-dependent dehydrogenase (short-subunit alcohol dehydrogenase family)
VVFPHQFPPGEPCLLITRLAAQAQHLIGVFTLGFRRGAAGAIRVFVPRVAGDAGGAAGGVAALRIPGVAPMLALNLAAFTAVFSIAAYIGPVTNAVSGLTGSGVAVMQALVGVASIAGLQGGHPGLLYATTKGAIVQMTRAMAAHHGGDLIRVNAVAPGFIESEMTAALGDSILAEVAKKIPAARIGTADEVAACVLFLASSAAAYVTGQVLTVDGGMTG